MSGFSLPQEVKISLDKNKSTKINKVKHKTKIEDDNHESYHPNDVTAPISETNKSTKINKIKHKTKIGNDNHESYHPNDGPAPISEKKKSTKINKIKRKTKIGDDNHESYHPNDGLAPISEKNKSEKIKKIIKTVKHKTKYLNNADKDYDPYYGPAPISEDKIKKYQRGQRINIQGIKTAYHKDNIIKTDKKIRYSVRQSAKSEYLLTEDSGFLEPDKNEDTFRIQQHDIVSAVDITSASKQFSLSLYEFGPYKINYSRDGRHLLLGGHRGHVAAMDWVTKRLLCEINVMESVHDLCWLHIPTMFATAQKEWVFVYDNKGTELHCIKKLSRVLQMEFLPYHFLLVTSSEKGFLSWLDISIGKLVKQTYTHAGRLNILCQNPYNAVVVTGHPNGTISMWSPNVEKPLVRMLCHPHSIRSVAIDPKGLYMATSGIDRNLKIWDVRTFKPLQSYRLGRCAGYLNFSQRGMLAAGLGNVVEIYKDCCNQTVSAPYLRHKVTTTISDIQFCPYEDILGIGYRNGFESILVPGCGEPNFDAFESNPFMTKSQRREMEVKALLEKIQPELITLNPSTLGKVNVPSLKEKLEHQKALLHVKPRKIDFNPPKKMKGRSKSANAFKRKKAVQEKNKREFIQKELKKKTLSSKIKIKKKSTDVLERFKTKTN